MSQSIIRNPDGTTRISEDEITQAAHAKTSKWLRLGRTMLASFWRRLGLDIEAAYARDPRELTQPDPFKPTSLTGKQIADIWLLNSKL